MYIPGTCDAGYWCVYGVDRSQPDGVNQTITNDTCYDGRMLGYGGRCPVGHYCPAGGISAYPIPCDNGTYADVEGLDACKICPAGKSYHAT